MNITSSTIQYIQNNNVKTFKIPKEDRNINFKKWAYNDVIQYIRLNEQKNKKNSKKSKANANKKNTIKYARLTTVRDNQIINGKKTLDQMKIEALIAANNLGVNSMEYTSIIKQIKQYGELILNKYYEDYIKQNYQFGDNYERVKHDMSIKIHDGLNQIIKPGQCIKVKIDKTLESTTFDAYVDRKHHATAFDDFLGFGHDNYYTEDNEKLYFKFIIPNDYRIDDIIEQIIETIGKTNLKSLNKFYQPKDKDYFVMDAIDIRGDKKDKLIEDGKFPAFLTTVKDEQLLLIPLDIFDFMMSMNNGALRNKIYYCQYNNFDMSNNFKIIGDDVIDKHFIKYFMNETIEFKGNDTKIAFITKILDKLLENMKLNISKYKDLYENKDNITGTDIKSLFNPHDYAKLMEEEKEEDKKESSKELMKKLKEDYEKSKKNKNEYAYLSDFGKPEKVPTGKIEIEDKKESSKELMKKLKEDYEKSKKNKNEYAYLSDFTTTIKVPKSTTPITTTEDVKPSEVKEVEEIKEAEEPKETHTLAKSKQPIKGVDTIIIDKRDEKKDKKDIKPIDPNKIPPVGPIGPITPITPIIPTQEKQPQTTRMSEEPSSFTTDNSDISKPLKTKTTLQLYYYDDIIKKKELEVPFVYAMILHTNEKNPKMITYLNSLSSQMAKLNILYDLLYFCQDTHDKLESKYKGKRIKVNNNDKLTIDDFIDNIKFKISTNKNFNEYDVEINVVRGTNEEDIKEIFDLHFDNLNKNGKGLYNAGLYDNIKEFINFRKDTKETLYYLLQRIIALEQDMKTVKNKMVSNDIRTNLRNKNIDLNNSDEEDFDDDDDNRGNGFMCSRCGMINPKFFKNDYPTLSEFREQFSKL